MSIAREHPSEDFMYFFLCACSCHINFKIFDICTATLSAPTKDTRAYRVVTELYFGGKPYGTDLDKRMNCNRAMPGIKKFADGTARGDKDSDTVTQGRGATARAQEMATGSGSEHGLRPGSVS